LNAMSRMYVRTQWASDIGHKVRRVLQELNDVEDAVVSAEPNGTTDGVLNVQHQTATSLVIKGYAERVGDDRIAITREGQIKIGRIEISRSERRHRKAAEALRAQTSGEWRPVPAGYSAQAQEDYADAIHSVAAAGAEVGQAKERLDWAQDMLRMSRTWGASEDELETWREEVEKAKEDVAKAEGHRDAMTRQQERRAA
jgi:hypothetical protein